MPALKEICDYLDDLLEISRFPHDPSNNGLQFQGVNEVHKAVFAVDASEAVFNIAADLDADFIFTHHGISWGSGIRRMTGPTATRIKALAANGISLYAAHLPLDAHEMIGHNALLGNMLNLKDVEKFGSYHDYQIGIKGTLPKAMSLKEMSGLFNKNLPSEGDFSGLGDFSRKIKHVAVISGGGAWPELFDEIAQSDVEALITGEFTHEIWHPALESGTSVLGLGHYRSETPGVIAVMGAIREQFQIETEFIDIPTGL